MAYCIKTYREHDLKESKFCESIQNFGEKILDSVEDFEKWITNGNRLMKCFIPIQFLYSVLTSIFLALMLVIFYKKIFYIKTCFEEGKEYNVLDVFEGKKKRPLKQVCYGENNIRVRFKIDRKFVYNKNDLFNYYSYYPKYFVDDLKTYRKLKLKKIK